MKYGQVEIKRAIQLSKLERMTMLSKENTNMVRLKYKEHKLGTCKMSSKNTGEVLSITKPKLISNGSNGYLK